MSPGSGESASLGRGRSLAVPAFVDDDGTADPQIRAALMDPSVETAAIARLLRGARLLTSVVAVADEVDPSGADTSSHMAVVSMVNERGERGLLAFTGTDSLAAWNPDARPVAAAGRDAARAALDDGATAVVVDVAGPGRRVITGLDLRVLADLLDLEAVEALVRAALADLAAPSGDSPVEFRVRDVRNDLDQGAPIDVLVELDVRAGGGPAADPSGNLAETAAGVLAERRDIQRLVPGGLGVAMASASSVRPR